MNRTPTIDELADRHLVGIDQTAQQSFLPGRVRVCATEPAVSTRAGQLTLWFMANLLSRQFQVIRRISFDVPTVAMQANIALFAGRAELAETLVATVKAVAGEKIEVVNPGSYHGSDDITVWVGHNPEGQRGSTRTIVVWGLGWKVFSGANDGFHPLNTATDNPLGSIYAACIAAGDCFRYITNWADKGRELVPDRYISLWDGKLEHSWSELPEGSWPETVNLPPFYLCGAGAVGQALVAALALCPKRTGNAVILDHDIIDGTNLNRYPLSHLETIDANKSEIAVRYLRSELFSVEPVSKRWEDYLVQGPHRSSKPVFVKTESRYKYELFISCVDNNEARHAIQNYWPRIILGGSTFRLGAQIMRYDALGGGECLKCNNPLQAKQTIEKRAAALRALPREQLDAALAALSPSKQEAVLKYLYEPKCGMVAEKYIDDLGRHANREFAVGFTSVGAGIILAGALVQHSLGVDALFNRMQNSLNASFENNSIHTDFFPRLSECTCSSEIEKIYNKLWGM